MSMDLGPTLATRGQKRPLMVPGGLTGDLAWGWKQVPPPGLARRPGKAPSGTGRTRGPSPPGRRMTGNTRILGDDTCSPSNSTTTRTPGCGRAQAVKKPFRPADGRVISHSGRIVGSRFRIARKTRMPRAPSPDRRMMGYAAPHS